MATHSALRPAIGRIVNSTKISPALSAPFVASIAPNTTVAATSTPRCAFSTTPSRDMRRPRRDNNKNRGVSSIYRSGPRYPLTVSEEEIPEPNRGYQPNVKVDPNHGLWEFFYGKEKLFPPFEELTSFGRAWTVEELRQKSWEDLHSLWWVCLKEKNRLYTLRREFQRSQLDIGDDEMESRIKEVRKTMKAIKHTLTERWYAWEDARSLAMSDPEVDLKDTQNPYKPSDYMEPEPAETQAVEGGEADLTKTDPSSVAPGASETQPPPGLDAAADAPERQQPSARP
ncbi:MRP-L47-domain-containing protein [Xylariomycetidae sp. FL0641]|nr:MRP-L47-domain-containing protein [Xylariomycetidae sp. FL0641]